MAFYGYGDSFSSSEANTPTFHMEDVKAEISSIVGLEEIKSHLMEIVQKITTAENQSCYGFTLVPPKPFHMVFYGNPGTGKSLVAQIIGKLFYLASVLRSHNVIEMEGHRARINLAIGGILVVDVGEQQHNSEVLQEIIALMDSGETTVIFTGTGTSLNDFIKANKGFFERISVSLRFNDLSCEELAMMFYKSLCTHSPTEDNDNTSTCSLHSSCTIQTIAEMMEKLTAGELCRKLNGHLIEPMVQETKKNMALRPGFGATGNEDQAIIDISDVQVGVSNAARKLGDVVLG